MDTKYKDEDPDNQVHETIVTQKVLDEVKELYPNFEVPKGIKIVPDDDINDTLIVICTRMEPGRNALARAGLPWHEEKCHNCGHPVIVGEHSPKKAPKMCGVCALDDERIPNDLKQQLLAHPQA